MPRTTDPAGLPLRPPRFSDASHQAALRAGVRADTEDRPGVYRMEAADGTILYVGKSIRVRTRLLSYFRAPPGDKAVELIRETARIRWDPIPNEFAALLTEMRLIQRHQPRFNVEHRRLRSFGFIKLTRERAPRLLLVGRVAADGAAYYGPFPQLRRVSETVRELVKQLGLRDCAPSTPVHFDDQLELLEGGRIPHCIRAELGNCLAPCASGCGARRYRERAETARRFLEGRGTDPLRELEQAMRAAAARREFEYAALLRDRKARLERLRDDLLAFQGRVAGLTFVYRVPGWKGDERSYLVRRGRILGEFRRPRGARKGEADARRLEELLARPDPGPGALTAEEAAEILLVSRWFRLRQAERKRTVPPEVWLRERRGPGGGAA